nr:cation:dicarboxylase symporter family transporter [Paraburkholderia podalyriae]
MGLATAFALHAGAGLHIDAHHLDTAILAQYSTRTQSHGLVEFALHLIPETLVGAFAKGEVLPVLLLALLFGFALNASGSAGRRVQEFIDSVAYVLVRILATFPHHTGLKTRQWSEVIPALANIVAAAKTLRSQL